MSESQSLVSVIIPVFNRQLLLARALCSVASQTYRDLEVIVIDDGSTEDVSAEVRAFAQSVEFPVIFRQQHNQGPGAARAHAVSLAKGVYFQYLDSDDEIAPTKIDLQVKQLQAKPDAVMCYTITEMVSPDGRAFPRKFSLEPASDLLLAALQWRRWGTPSCLWRYPVGMTIPWVSLYHGEDLVHDVGVGVQNSRIRYVPERLTKMYGGVGNVSSGNSSNKARQRLRVDSMKSHEMVLGKLQHSNITEETYWEALAERFFYLGHKYYKSGDCDFGDQAFKYAIQASRKISTRAAAILHRRILSLVSRKWPMFTTYVWRTRRFIVPRDRHFLRGI